MSCTRLEEENRKLEENNKILLQTLSMYYSRYNAIFATFVDILKAYEDIIKQQTASQAANLPTTAKKYIQTYTTNQILAVFTAVNSHEIIAETTRSSKNQEAIINQPAVLKTHINWAIDLELALSKNLPSNCDSSLFQKAKKAAVSTEHGLELSLLNNIKSNLHRYKNNNKSAIVSKVLDCIATLNSKILNHLDTTTLVGELGASIEEAKKSENKYYKKMWFFAESRKNNSSLNPILEQAATVYDQFMRNAR
ncbi:MAG: hypothetical protein WAW86_01480 [Gammaproteobacteria bacterium]